MPQGEISLDLKATKRKAILSLKDNGIGIPKKAKKHIFSDIYRAENARQSQEEGTGFGLLQVQRIVKMLHGKITFCSEEGKGTTFIVTLPRTTTVAEPVSVSYTHLGILEYTSLWSQLKNIETHNDEIWNILKIGECIYFQSFSSWFKYDGKKVTAHYNSQHLPLYFHKAHGQIYVQTVSYTHLDVYKRQK